jgi:phosphocarrier protein HPr
MISQAVTIINKLGLHARAATRLVNRAAAFECEIWIGNGEKTINGKSIMGVLTLAASKGTQLSIEVEGMDENQAIEDLIELINNRFGEEE